MRRPVLHIILGVGMCTSLAGGLLVGFYVVEAWIARIGEPDQSLLFWYLPLLFMGASLLAAGVVLVAWVWRSLHPPPAGPADPS